MDALEINNEDHRNAILKAARCFLPSPEHRLHEWLHKAGLDYYYENFVASELIDLGRISRLNLPDETVYDDLEITLPGHKRRLERAVQQLRKRQRRSDTPLSCGYWGRPVTLQDAKYDFLCVTAEISSTKVDPSMSGTHTVEFMVDSGSDVVTLKEETLDKMDLELLGTIRSRGVHASKEKKLYLAKLRIGTEEIETEVMPESYDSIGSRVIRHFRHYIDGEKHVWLKGNYSEPTNEDASSANKGNYSEPTSSAANKEDYSEPTNQDALSASKISSGETPFTVRSCDRNIGLVNIMADTQSRSNSTTDTSNCKVEQDSKISKSCPTMEHGGHTSEAAESLLSNIRK